jgi:hypothetical protein
VRGELGFEQDAYCFTARVAAAGKSGDLQAVHEAFEEACQKSACTLAVCNAAIEALSRCGDVEVCTPRLLSLVQCHVLVDVAAS